VCADQETDLLRLGRHGQRPSTQPPGLIDGHRLCRGSRLAPGEVLRHYAPCISSDAPGPPGGPWHPVGCLATSSRRGRAYATPEV